MLPLCLGERRAPGLHVVEAAAHHHAARHDVPGLAACTAHPTAALLVRAGIHGARVCSCAALRCGRWLGGAMRSARCATAAGPLATVATLQPSQPPLQQVDAHALWLQAPAAPGRLPLPHAGWHDGLHAVRPRRVQPPGGCLPGLGGTRGVGGTRWLRAALAPAVAAFTGASSSSNGC